MMGHYGMLQCAANFSDGYGGKLCDKCGFNDDENHRINICPKWHNVNQRNEDGVTDYDQIYSDDEKESMQVISKIISMWDLGNGRNCMRMDPQS